MVERRSRERRRRVRPEPVGAEAPGQHCPPVAAPLAVLTEEAEPTMDSGLDPVADSARAQQELQDWLEPRGAPTRQEVDPGQFEWPSSPPSIRRTTTPPRSIPRPIPSTTRGEAAGAAAPDEFREPALIIAPPNLPASERRELETAVELQLRQNWDPERGWQGYLDRRDEAAQILRPDQPIQYPQPYRGKRIHARTRSEWTPEIALQIRRDRIQARDNRRAMEREYEPAHNCPRCATAYTLWEGRPAHEARFGPSATVTRPPQEPERQPAPMEIEGVREQPNQSAAVSQPPSTPPPSATTRRQDEREPTRPPTTPPSGSTTMDAEEPRRFLHRPQTLPPVRDSGAERTTTLPRPFPVLPEERHIEAPATVAPVPAPRTIFTTASATPPPNIAAASVNSSAPASITMPIPGLARLMAAMTPADHEEFRVLVAVAVTMPQSVQEQMYAAFFDRIRQAQ
ncbi:hypothetical protein QAD02_021034 [Eretmocerus hayati]|uniref:Uncharacterized protein n=1 Tax=Eretmocerus hayati TaxID=131215 RepID=A0ACC2PR03_9HYME|nr:hypothetical protein QAD02_021034 [Eretmocerus hayati]